MKQLTQFLNEAYFGSDSYKKLYDVDHKKGINGYEPKVGDLVTTNRQGFSKGKIIELKGSTVVVETIEAYGPPKRKEWITSTISPI